MPNTFRQRIRESINNETLQIALDNNTERRLKGRALAFESIPDWRERRQRAHKIRADVIEHLDSYLSQFITHAEANGMTVHRAKDAAEAIQIVLNITKDLPQRRRERKENQKEISVDLRSHLHWRAAQVSSGRTPSSQRRVYFSCHFKNLLSSTVTIPYNIKASDTSMKTATKTMDVSY